MKRIINRVLLAKKSFKKSKDIKERILYFLAVVSGLGFLGSIIVCVSVIIIFTVFSSTLPSPSRLVNRPIAESTKIFDRNGSLLYSVFQDKNRTLITLDDVSPYLVDATLAAEDADFYLHEGLDPFGIVRGIFITVTGRGKQGGSTITQQVAKIVLLTSERTVIRKIKDMVLSLQIERNYPKDDILQMYLNEINYGGQTWGAEAAAKIYFNKSAKNLDLAESALLAGLPQAPSRYSPFINPDAAKNRQRYVLKLMHERGWVDKEKQKHYLSNEEYQATVDEELNYTSLKGSLQAPHFVMYILDLLKERYGEETVDSGGLRVTTSLDLNLQDEYQKIVREEIEKASSLNVSNAGLVAIEPGTRQILAMVGSVDYFSKDIDGQFNVATQGLRQPGSALKPFTYLTGLMQGYTASTLLYDVFTEFDRGEGLEPYPPENYSGWGFRGPIQVRYALANSVNVTAVKMLDLVGIPNMVKTANDLGVKSLKYNPSINGLALTLGGGEVTLLDITTGFSSIADKGVYKDVSPILGVTDSKGTVLEKYTETSGKQVVDSGLVWIITDILSDNEARTPAFGSRSQLYIPNQKVAVKTGTSNDLKDNWTIGFTQDIAIGVWVGNNGGKPMNSRLASGLTGASPIWNRAINYYLKDHPNSEFPKPDNVVDAWVGTLSGMVQYEGKEDRRVEYFVKGTEPKAKSDIFQRVKVCKDGEIKDKTYVFYKAERPEWQPFLEDWIKDKYKDDKDSLYTYLGSDYEKEKNPDKFDLENCGN